MFSGPARFTVTIPPAWGGGHCHLCLQPLSSLSLALFLMPFGLFYLAIPRKPLWTSRLKGHSLNTQPNLLLVPCLCIVTLCTPPAHKSPSSPCPTASCFGVSQVSLSKVCCIFPPLCVSFAVIHSSDHGLGLLTSSLNAQLPFHPFSSTF